MLRREIRGLIDIADSIDDHAKNGQPYNLTFFNAHQAFGEATDPEFLTETQREKLESYLKENFTLWATSWLYMESDRIRQLIGSPLRHN